MNLRNSLCSWHTCNVCPFKIAVADRMAKDYQRKEKKRERGRRINRSKGVTSVVCLFKNASK